MFMLRYMGLVALTVFLNASPSLAGDLRTFLLSQIEAKEFPIHTFDADYRLYVWMEKQPSYWNLEDAEMMYEAARDTNLQVSNFEILARNDSEHITSVYYQYDWSAQIGNTNLDGTVVNHALLRRAKGGWKTLYEASEQ